MVEILPYLSLWGETFSPSRAGTMTGLTLSNAREPGEPLKSGRQPARRAGLAILKPPESIPEEIRLTWLIEMATAHLSAFRAQGATICKFNLSVLWMDQCNLCFESEDLARIAALGIQFTISCYPKGDVPSW